MIPDDSAYLPGGPERPWAESWIGPAHQSWRKGWTADKDDGLGPGLTSLNDAKGLGRFRRGPALKWWKQATREVVARDHGYLPMDRAFVAVRVWLPFHLARRDSSNYALVGKACLDGLVTWVDEHGDGLDWHQYMLGILPDDNDRHVIGPLMLRGHDPGIGANLCRVQVIVRELAPDEGRWWPRTEGE